MSLSFHPEDVAGLNAAIPESNWKPPTQSSGYSPRVTSQEQVLTADGAQEGRTCCVLFVSWSLA